jgi:hypothetical protein
MAGAKIFAGHAVILAIALTSMPAGAFCGFYVGKADAGLFNDASQVIMVRDGERTSITMRNDYKGPLKEFALVVPVPQVLKQEDVKIASGVIFDRIDAYSAPRLAEYYDRNPCPPPPRADGRVLKAPQRKAMAPGPRGTNLGVKIEAEFTVGEYDIVILSAKESNGLERWLRLNKYRIPKGAAKALAPYINQKQMFFVARINLAEQAKTGSEFLRPLQFSFNTEKFMLPIRLGMINARGPQDLVLWVLTRTGRVETTNYRTVKLPANVDLPPYIKSDEDHSFRNFYRSLFDEQAKREGYRVVFTEYFWDMSWCDPCAANPLTVEELRHAGVQWVEAGAARRGAGAQPVRVTRLHIRYTPETFPEDLMFQETKDRQNYQTRYVLRHPWGGAPDACPQAEAYFQRLPERQEKEAQTLATLTGWDINYIRWKIGLIVSEASSWWKDLWQWVGVRSAEAGSAR